MTDETLHVLPKPSDRHQYLVSSETTYLQTETEDECCPFFVDLEKLPEHQITHLRQVGLLAPLLSGSRKTRNGENNYVSGDSDNDEIIEVDFSSNVAADISSKNSKSPGEEEEEEDEWDQIRRKLKEKQSKSKVSSHIGTEDSKEPETEPEEDYDEENLMEKRRNRFGVCLLRSKHVDYLERALLVPLSSSFVCLDSSRPWMIYWCLHSLELLDKLPPPKILIRIVEQIQLCWYEYDDAKQEKKKECGGYGGGPGQIPHCATSYAAVLALSIIAAAYDDAIHKKGGKGKSDKNKNNPQIISSSPSLKDASKLAQDTLKAIRPKLYRFYMDMRVELPHHHQKNKNKKITGFSMHNDGENDVRSVYCTLSVCKLLNLLTTELTDGVRDYVINCQNRFEGGFGGEPMNNNEAHGGYTFCGTASMYILDEFNRNSDINLNNNKNNEDIDRQALLTWLAKRQMPYEGGFSGRCNKLVDGCYSFWLGGSLSILSEYYFSDNEKKGNSTISSNSPFFDGMALQRYILLCGQNVDGGLRDKPSKSCDFYHSCYCLSGLSVAQGQERRYSQQQQQLIMVEEEEKGEKAGNDKSIICYGNTDYNFVVETHPVFNIGKDKIPFLYQLFYNNDQGSVSTH